MDDSMNLHWRVLLYIISLSLAKAQSLVLLPTVFVQYQSNTGFAFYVSVSVCVISTDLIQYTGDTTEYSVVRTFYCTRNHTDLHNNAAAIAIFRHITVDLLSIFLPYMKRLSVHAH